MCSQCASIIKREAARARADRSGGAGPSRIGQDPQPVTIAHKPSPMDAAARQKKDLNDYVEEESRKTMDIEAEIRRQKGLLHGLLEDVAD